MERDYGTDSSVLKVLEDGGRQRLDDIDLTFSNCVREQYGFKDDDFSSPYGETVHERSWQQGDWTVRIQARTQMHCDRQNFYINADLDGCLNGERSFCRSWTEKVPRNPI